MGARSFWLFLAAVLVGTATLLAWQLRNARALRPGAVSLITIAGPTIVGAGASERYQILVSDARTGDPEANVGVELHLLDTQRHHATLRGRTDAHGAWTAEVQLPRELHRNSLVLARLPAQPGVTASVSLRAGRPETFVSTDKPQYQPGQNVEIRALTLGPDRAPLRGADLTIEVRDASDIKLFEKTRKTSELGIAHARFRLADEIGLGSYWIKVRVESKSGEAYAERRFEVQRYAVPKGTVSVALEADRAAPGATLRGSVQATWSSGKPIGGAELGVHLRNANTPPVFRGKTDAQGKLAFAIELPRSGGSLPVIAVAGVGGGATLGGEATVRIPSRTLAVDVVPESGAPVAGVDNRVFVLTSDADGNPVSASVRVEPGGQSVRTDADGLASVSLVIEPDGAPLTFVATNAAGGTATTTLTPPSAASADGLLLRAARPALPAGQTVPIRALARPEHDGPVALRLWQHGRLIASAAGTLRKGAAEIALDVPAAAHGLVKLEAARFLERGKLLRDTRVFLVEGGGLDLRASVDRETHAPGGTARLDVEVRGPGGAPTRAALGLSAVDEAFFALVDQRPDLERRFFGFQRSLETLDDNVEHGSARIRSRYRVADRERFTEQLAGAASAPADLQWAALALLSANHPASSFSEAWMPDRVLVSQAVVVRRLAGWCMALPLIFGLALLVLFFGHALGRLSREGPVADVEAGEREAWLRAARRVGVAWLLALLLPPLAAVLTAPLVESLPSRKERWAIAVALGGVALALLGGLVRQLVLLGRTGVARRVPRVVRATWLLPAAGLLISANTAAIVVDKGRRMLDVIEPREHAWMLILSVIGLWQLAFGALAMLRRSAVEPTSRARRLGLVLGRAALLGLPLTLAAFGVAAAEAAEHPEALLLLDELEDASFYAENDYREGGTGTRAKGGAGSMGPPIPHRESARDAAEPPRVRRNFPETLLWLPELVTDAAGRAHVEVPLADSVTTYRVSLSAVSASGALGSLTLPLTVLQDFFVDVTAPATLTQGDEIALPVTVHNHLTTEQPVTLVLQADGFAVIGGAERRLVIEPRAARAASFRVRAERAGRQRLRVSASGESLSDAVERTVRVEPDGHPIVQTLNGRFEGRRVVEVALPDAAIEGGTEVQLKLYGSVLGQIAEGLGGVFRWPTGCFEQTSATTYPNVLVLDFMKRAGATNPALEDTALGYIAQGYQRLLRFGVPGGGFSYFGKPPASAVLTAYGLMEFHDMARVYPVDPQLIERTRDFLSKAQRPDGTWVGTTDADDTLHTTAYVAWSLAETGDRGPHLTRALDRVASAAGVSGDAYEIALAANALAAAGEEQRARALLEPLRKLARRDGRGAHWSSRRMSLMHSFGDSMNVETTALAALALSRLDADRELRAAALEWIGAARGEHGTWSSTAATVAAMRALLAGGPPPPGADQTVSVIANGQPAGEVSIPRNARDVHHLVGLTRHAASGDNTIELRARGAGALVYQLVATHHLPWSAVKPADLRPLRLAVDYQPTRVRAGETITCRARLAWARDTPGTMPLLELGVPPGFDVEAADLQALVTKGAIQRYSLGSDKLTLYLDRIERGRQVELRYRLRARVPLRARAPASVAYLYYEPEARAYARPVALTASEQ